MNQTNYLAGEKSPYLLQHLSNPVAWYPWCPEAFARAQAEDKPVFLSIGYSTCHWCHVMAHESFEDAEVATLLNEAFVCIKVDREERPDIDGIYMNVVQMLTGSGGWPMTIVMTPDKKPFFGGTYFPKASRFGRVGMLDLVPRISEIWKTRRVEVLNSAQSLVNGVQELSKGQLDVELNENILELAYKQLESRFDQTYGGFGDRPKFPTPHNLLFLLRYWQQSKNQKALQMVQTTLKALRAGGIFDQVGFGFHRYSTDREWLLPHFEKMLYDQALLAMAYTEAFLATGEDLYKRTAEEIFEYVLRDMQDPKGGFYSAEDADSEGEEGKFYIWTTEEITECLGRDLGGKVCELFNLKKDGNFTDEATGEHSVQNILHLKQTEDLNEANQVFKMARLQLYERRKQRTHPLKDDKILTDWNGLMIAAFAQAAAAFGRPEYSLAAEKATQFVLLKMRSADGRLYHSYREGQFVKQAYLDDYAFMAWALLELYEATFKPEYLQQALDLTGYALKHYWDEQAGGFFFTADDGEKLITRQKEIYDGALPSGNSVFVEVLLKLSCITGKTSYEDKALAIIKTFSEQASSAPLGYSMLMCALSFAFGETKEIVIVGQEGSEETEKMLETLQRQFLPNAVLLLKTPKNSLELEQISELVKGREMVNGKPTAYVCANGACQMPVNDLTGLKNQLQD
jgi:uncharacterized protein